MHKIRLLISYTYKVKYWLFVILIIILLMTGILLLNGIDIREVGYGVCLSLFAAFIAFILGYYRFWKRYGYLKYLEKNIEVQLDKLPAAKDCLEDEYQILIKKLFYYYNDVLNKKVNTFKDMEEYYSIWVHQIKTPIAAMKLLLQEKAGDIDVSAEQAQLFRIEQYVEMALWYMRLDSESSDFVIRKINVHNVVKEAVHKYARMFIQKKIKLDFKEFDAEVISDEKWLEFVIEQVLSNAVKYTNEGCVSVYIESVKNYSEETKSVSNHKEETVLVIEDTGVGINSADLPRICEKGYTGYNGHDDKLSTGIGLYLCSRVIKKLSHKMVIESEEGNGTKVKIIFYNS